MNFSTYKVEIKSLIKLAAPMVIGQVGQMMMGVVDSIMVGQLGAAELAASALANGLFALVLMFGGGISLAISPIVAKFVGEKKLTECGVALRQSIIVSVVFAIILTPILILGAELIPLTGQKEDVAILAVSYAKILAWSTAPFLLFSTYKCFTEGVSITTPAMIIMLLANIFNAIANWALIFGHFGLDAMGLDGAGWGTLSTRIVMLVAIIIFTIRSKRLKKYDPSFHFRRFDISLMKRIIKIGVPTGVQYLFEGGAFITSAFLIGMLGKNELAAHQIAMNIATITYMSYLGLSMASSIRIAEVSATKDRAKISHAAFATLWLTLAVVSFNMLIFIILNNFIPTLYIDETAVIMVASGLMLLAGAFQIPDGIQAVLLGLLRGLSDVKIPTRITFVAYWVLGIPIGLLLGFYFELGVYGIWAGFISGLTASAILMFTRLKKLLKMTNELTI